MNQGPLATQHEVQSVRASVDTLSREVSNYRREGKDREERLFEALAREQLARERLANEFARKMNTRRRFEAAGLAAAVTLIVGLSQVFSAHNYAQAQVQVQAMNRTDRANELEQLKAHDELIIKRAVDERDARFEMMIVKAGAK